MDQMAEKDVRAAWNCMWTRAGHLCPVIVGDPFDDLRSICVRPPAAPRQVADEECARCQFWEPEAER